MEGAVTILKLLEVTKTEEGFVKEIYESDSDRVSGVSVTYTGTEESLDNFLMSLILTYARKHKMID